MAGWGRSYGYGGFAPYVSVAERRDKAAREMDKLRKHGHAVSPVVIEGRKIATTFWGQAWCDNLEGYADFASRLERGRTYVRNGSVVDLQITAGQVVARVAGSHLYRTAVKVAAVPAARWEALRKDCAGGIDTLVALLKGQLTRPVMERICRRGDGLFPAPTEIEFECSCPDYAYMCKHVAAVLYGVGARLDHAPELLFALRAVDHAQLIAGVAAQLPLGTKRVAKERVLVSDDLAALFGLDLALEVAAAPTVTVSGSEKGKAKAREKGKAKAREKGKAKARAKGKAKARAKAQATAAPASGRATPPTHTRARGR